MHRRPPRRLPAWSAAKAEARLLALLSPDPAPSAGWTPDNDPALSPPPRVDPGRHGALSLVAVAAVVVALVAVQAWRHRPQQAVLPRPLPTASAGTAAQQLVVDVEGAVRRPGLVTLASGQRVADALRAAGGVKPGASTTGVNLARLVVDGEQIVVGGAAAASRPAAAAEGLVDLNSATVEQLDALPGVGPVLAQRIVDWRAQHGRFAEVGQLREVQGIGERKYGDLSKRVTV